MDDTKFAKKLQSEQLKILKELDRVCKKLNLTYVLAFGTSLGARRHKGFIPWDDDIDVYMRIEELEFLQKHSSMFGEGYFLQHNGSDPEYVLMISRLRNSGTTLIERTEVDRDINHGIFIDIYPLFHSPEKGFGARRLVVISMIYRLMLCNRMPRNRGLVMKIGSGILLKIIPEKMKKRLVNRCYKILRNSPETGYLSSLYGDEANIRYPSCCFFPVQWVPFEDGMAPVQADWDLYLKKTYGDYMELPPEENRKFHHDFVYVDFDRPYKEYKGTYYCRKQ